MTTTAQALTLFEIAHERLLARLVALIQAIRVLLLTSPTDGEYAERRAQALELWSEYEFYKSAFAHTIHAAMLAAPRPV